MPEIVSAKVRDARTRKCAVPSFRTDLPNRLSQEAEHMRGMLPGLPDSRVGVSVEKDHCSLGCMTNRLTLRRHATYQLTSISWRLVVVRGGPLSALVDVNRSYGQPRRQFLTVTFTFLRIGVIQCDDILA
jgi:hypothetical protein